MQDETTVSKADAGRRLRLKAASQRRVNEFARTGDATPFMRKSPDRVARISHARMAGKVARVVKSADGFGIDREAIAKAMVPKQLVTALRYSQGTAKVGGSGSRLGGAAKNRLAQKEKAGQPAESLTRAFNGMNLKPKAAPAGPTAGQEAFTRGMAGATAPKAPRVTKPTNEAAAAGNQATNDARGAMRGRANRQRTDRIIAGTAGTAAVGSLGVLGYDKATRRQAKSKRVSVAA
jgi:hypothetical protein